ncbi:aspartyl protease family protein [Lysobacter sp. GCM10012299]|uniref:aspartyl protease family protein n=1 Tax=Lysobacter sp. GCM10012299 TaxID=3317333 RepID=UPI003615FA3B
MHRLTIGILALATALSLAGCTQVELARLYLANNGTAAEMTKPLPLTLPYKDVDGWVLLPARVNGRASIDFVLDTGASVVALIADQRTTHLDLDMRGVRRLGAPDDLAAPVGARQDGLAIDFGGVVLENQTALAIPAESLDCKGEQRRVAPFNGVIGHDLFRRFTVEVNRDNGTVTLHDPDSYHYRGSGRIVPAEIAGRQPFIDARVAPSTGAPYRARLHVDSGAGIDMTLFPGSSPAIKAPPGGRGREACFVGGRATYTVGAPVHLGLAGGVITTPVEYATGREVIAAGQNGRLGARFLARFNVVFDYARERIILEPRRRPVVVAHAPGH